MLGLTYSNARKLREAAGWESHTLLVLAELEAIAGRLSDAQRVQRGYIITGKDHYLTQYGAAVAALGSGLQTLESLTADNPIQQARIRDLDPLTARTLAFLDRIVELRRRSGRLAAERMVATDSGKHLVDSALALTGTMAREEHRLLALRRERALASAHHTTATLVGAGILALAIVGLTGLVMRTELSQRQRSQAALEASELRFRSITQSAADGIVAADSDGNIVSWNGAAGAIFGYEDAEIVGRSLTLLMPERYREAHQRGLERLQVSGERRAKARTVELEGMRKDGSVFPLELSLSAWATREGQFVGGILRDITLRKEAEQRLHRAKEELELAVAERTADLHAANGRLSAELEERRQAEEALRRSNDELRALVQASPLAIVGVDARGEVRNWYGGAEVLFGLSRDAAVGRPLANVPPGRENEVRRLRERVLAGESIDGFETVRRRKDGSLVDVSISAAPLHDERGRATGLIYVYSDITERKRAEARIRSLVEELEAKVAARTADLQSANRRLEHELAFVNVLLDNLESGIVACDAAGNLTLFNRFTRELHGLPELPVPPEEWAKHYDLFLPGGRTPMTRDEVPLFRALSGERIRDVEMTVVAKDRAPRTLLASGQAMVDSEGGILGAVVVMHDITARKVAEATLREREELFTAFADNSPTVSFMKDEDGRYVYVNHVFRQRFGLSAAAVVGRTDAEYLPPQVADELRANDLATLAGGVPVELVERVPTPDGRSSVWRVFKFPFTQVSGRRLVGGVAMDITAQQAAEEELREAKEAAEAGTAAKSQFLANMSHELRTPLNAIKGYIELVAGGEVEPVSDTQREFLEIAARNTDRLLALIDDLLDVNRLQSHNFQVRAEPVDLAEALRHVAVTFRHTARLKGLTFDDGIGTLPRITGDRDRLIQVFSNLVSNAIKYTPNGAVGIRTSAPAGSVEVEVYDTGIGMTGDEREQLFTKFFRGQDRVVRDAGGTGLGLVIVRAIVEQHGGRIDVESRKGEGSRFRVSLPAAGMAG